MSRFLVVYPVAAFIVIAAFVVVVVVVVLYLSLLPCLCDCLVLLVFCLLSCVEGR